MTQPKRHGVAFLANLVLTSLGQGIGIIGQILMVPAFLAAWGDTIYGDWLTLSALSAYLTLTDMGMQVYVVNKLTGHSVRGEHESLKTTLHSAILLYLTISAIAVVGLLLIAFILPWQSWFAGRALGGQTVRLIVLMLGLGAVLSVWGGFLSGIYRVLGEPQRSSGVGLVQRSAALAITLGVLAAGLSPLAMAATQLGMAVVWFTWIAIDVSRRSPVTVLSLGHARPKEALAMLFPSSLFALVGVANGLTVQGTLLITSALLGPAAVTVFSTSRTLANAVRQLVALIGSVVWPEFTRMDAGGASSTLASAHRVLVKASSLLTIWIVSSLWFTGPVVHQLWTKGRTGFDNDLLHLLLVHAMLLTPSWASGVLLAATNRHRALSLLFLLQGLITVSLSWLLIKPVGLPGVGLALILADFPTFGLLVPLWSLRVVGERLREFVLDVYVKMALIFAATWLAAWGMQMAPLPPIWKVFSAIAATFPPVGLAAFFWLRPDERALVMRILSRRRVASAAA